MNADAVDDRYKAEVAGLMERIVAVAISGGDTASLKEELKKLLKQQELEKNNDKNTATKR